MQSLSPNLKIKTCYAPNTTQLQIERNSSPTKEVEEIQQDATVCRYLFTGKLLYMFRTSIAPIVRGT